MYLADKTDFPFFVLPYFRVLPVNSLAYPENKGLDSGKILEFCHFV